MLERGFDSHIYIASQTAAIKLRIRKFKRLYLEFGGKLCFDHHASRVLPGYNPKNKVKIIKELGDCAIVYCINAKDLESNKRIGKAKRTYQNQILKDLRDMKRFNLNSDYIVINRFEGEKNAQDFANILKKKDKKVFFQPEIPKYEDSPKLAIKGFKDCNYVPIHQNLIIITGPAGNSGKMFFAMSQVYHEQTMGENSGFAKFETFPVHNLELNHPINIAYEAATADIQDVNMEDKHHEKYYNIKSINYNRDIKNYEILKEIMKITRKTTFPFGYKSPTDMGINMIKDGILNESKCIKAAKDEIISRYNYYVTEYNKGREKKKTIERIKEILKKIKK